MDMALKYYHAMGKKNFAEIEACLHPEVELLSPLAEKKGKADVAQSARYFATICESLKVRASFGSHEQAMVAFDLVMPNGVFRSASLLTFKEGLIEKIELFYDGRQFETKKKDVFG